MLHARISVSTHRGATDRITSKLDTKSGSKIPLRYSLGVGAKMQVKSGVEAEVETDEELKLGLWLELGLMIELELGHR